MYCMNTSEEVAPVNLNYLTPSMTLQHVLIADSGHIDALFLDLAKALDKVLHQCLCLKLSHYGI